MKKELRHIICLENLKRKITPDKFVIEELLGGHLKAWRAMSIRFSISINFCSIICVLTGTNCSSSCFFFIGSVS